MEKSKLKQCEACKKQVSRAAKVCSHCGHPLANQNTPVPPNEPSMFSPIMILGYIFFGLIGWVIWSNITSDQTSNITTTDSKESRDSKYEILSSEKYGLPSENFYKTWVLYHTKSMPSDNELKRVMRSIWKDRGMNFDEFTVFLYLPEMDTKGGAYCLAEFKDNKMSDFKINKLLLYGKKWENK